jgi:hypothetical protein
MTTVLTDIQVNALKSVGTSHREKQVQGGKFFPVIVDLSTAGITIGRAILERINAESDLADALGVSVPMTKEQEESILNSITYLAVVPPGGSPLDILAYAGAGTDKVTAGAGLVFYEPSHEIWRNYVANGVAATLVRLGLGS